MKFYNSETNMLENYTRVRIQITEEDLLKPNPMDVATDRALSYYCPEDEWWVVRYSKRLSKMSDKKSFKPGIYYVGYRTYKKT